MRYGLGATCFLDLFLTCVLVVMPPSMAGQETIIRYNFDLDSGSVWVCLKMGYTGIPSKYPFHAGKMIMNRLTIKFGGSLFSDKLKALDILMASHGTFLGDCRPL